jgi:hypothetical protein
VVELQSTEQDTEKKISELVCYLWDNYLETCDSTDIVVMGVGHSYIGVRDLLSKRGKYPPVAHDGVLESTWLRLAPQTPVTRFAAS